ncbi:MAG: hypothetical protein ABIN36_12330 [Ferruginibacter sp.]
MKIIDKIILGCLFYFLGPVIVFAQSENHISITGQWKCVKHDFRGKQKFSLQQAGKIKSSVLTIKKNTFSYNKLSFIQTCTFNSWEVAPYDTSEYTNLELIFTKPELEQVKVYSPLDKKGDFACYNDCSLFYLKQDTLINVCGGYTFYLKKVK